MNKTQLIDSIAAKTDLSKYQAKKALEEILTGVRGAQALAHSNQVQLDGFGVFKVNGCAGMSGRDPQTGQEIHIDAIPAYVFSKALINAVNIKEPQSEPVKRLKPTNLTQRELYVLSGNSCAFTKCSQKLIDENGHYIGQICHIEAAETGGQRFNPNQTNDQRRHISNLMLMCPNHHKLTDNVIEYTVDKLKMMKAAHEEKFRDGSNGLDVDTPNELKDSGLEKQVLLPTNLNTLDINLSDYDPNFFNDVLDYINKVANLAFETRKFYLVAFQKGYMDHDQFRFDPREVKLFVDFDIDKHVSILQRAELLSLIDDDDYPSVFYCFIGFDKDDNQINFLQSVKKIYGEQSDVLEDMFLRLKFNILESN